MKKQQRLLLLGLLMNAYPLAWAIDLPIVNNPSERNNWVLESYIDTSYNYLTRSNRFISGSYNRVNDLDPNGFTLQQLYLKVGREPPTGLGGLFDIVVGRDAGGIAPQGMNPDIFDSQNLQVTIPQAYLQYGFGSTLVSAGQMLTLAGIETYAYTHDNNFSRSILDGYAQPGTHIGMRISHQLNEHINLIGGFSNGWSTVRNAAQPSAFELGVNYAPSESFSFLLNTFTNRQHLTNQGDTGPTSWRNLLDWFGTWYITKQFSIGANYDYGMQSRAALPNSVIGRAQWQGIAGYAHYILNEKWSTSFRGEIFDDSDGYRTGVKQNWREITFTLAYLPIKSLQFRAETRHDFSNVGAFLDNNHKNTNNNQQSYALELLYLFF